MRSVGGRDRHTPGAREFPVGGKKTDPQQTFRNKKATPEGGPGNQCF